jgi:hypothetical protein
MDTTWRIVISIRMKLWSAGGNWCPGSTHTQKF